MKLFKPMTLIMIAGAGIAAWFMLGKPTSFAQIQAAIGGVVGKVEGAVGIGGGTTAHAHLGGSSFHGGWVGAVGNPGFDHHGFDHPGIPGIGYGHELTGFGHPDFDHHGGFGHPDFDRFRRGGGDFDDRFRGTGWGIIPGYGGGYPGYPPGPWYGNPYDRRFFRGGFRGFGDRDDRFSHGGGPGGGFSMSGPGFSYSHGGGPGGGVSFRR